MLKACRNNRLASSPAYQKIMHEYNEELKRRGKVNNKRFYEEIVSKEIPDYTLGAWYDFLRKFRTSVGLETILVPTQSPIMKNRPFGDAMLAETGKTLQGNQAATASFIQSALNIGAQRAREILENPGLMTAKEAMDFAIKAMKAQDSRIHAIGKIREDNREEEKLDRAFTHEAYEE